MNLIAALSSTLRGNSSEKFSIVTPDMQINLDKLVIFLSSITSQGIVIQKASSPQEIFIYGSKQMTDRDWLRYNMRSNKIMAGNQEWVMYIKAMADDTKKHYPEFSKLFDEYNNGHNKQPDINIEP